MTVAIRNVKFVNEIRSQLSIIPYALVTNMSKARGGMLSKLEKILLRD